MTGKGGIVCAVYSCNNYSFSKNARSFFRFPRDVEQCRRWVLRSERQDLYDIFEKHGPMYLNNNQRICSDHFTIEDFRNPNLLSQGLRRGVLPTKKLGRESEEQEGADEPNVGHSAACKDSELFGSTMNRNVGAHPIKHEVDITQGFSEESSEPQENMMKPDEESTYDGSSVYCVMTLATDDDGEFYVPSRDELYDSDHLEREPEAVEQKETPLPEKLIAVQKKLDVAQRVISNQRTLIDRLKQENYKLRTHCHAAMKEFRLKNFKTIDLELILSVCNFSLRPWKVVCMEQFIGVKAEKEVQFVFTVCIQFKWQVNGILIY